MNMYRAIKLLYSLTFSIVNFIIWCFISFFTIHLMPNTRVFILAIAMVLMMQYLSTKFEKKSVVFGPPFLLGLVTVIFLFGKTDYVANIIYVVLNMFLLAREDEESIEYSSYRGKIIKGFYTLAILGLLLLGINQELRAYLLRFYILFLILSIILLRESRRFRYNIKGKNTIYTNIMVIILTVILSSDVIFNFVTLIFKLFWVGLSYVTGFLVIILIFLLQKPAAYLESLIQKNFHIVKGQKPEEIDTGRSWEALKNMRQEVMNDIPPLAVFIFKILVLLIIAFIVYRIYRKYRFRKRDQQEGIVETREKIIKETSNEKRNIIDAIRDMFLDKGPRTQILRVYQSFQKRASEKNLFKRHMTATQLYNVTKAYVSHSEPVRGITEIYNEAKFSQHPVSDAAVKEVKEQFKIIKKQVDELKDS